MLYDGWQYEYRPISDRLATVLEVTSRGGRAKQSSSVDSLSEHLGLDPDQLGDPTYHLLTAMLPELDRALENGPGDSAGDSDTHRGHEIVASAVEALGVDELIAAVDECGWGRRRIGRDTEIRRIEATVRATLVQQLAQRVYTMLDRWRRLDAWNPARELGICSARPRRRAESA